MDSNLASAEFFPPLEGDPQQRAFLPHPPEQPRGVSLQSKALQQAASS